MITELRIRNFALIQSLDLKLKKGFSVITGETGSGKSILLNALGLLLGDRADFSMIGRSSDKAVVEAVIDLAAYQLDDLFEEHDLDLVHPSIIRREVSTAGRSRAFINDTPVQLNVLRQLTEKLVNIHSQYNTLELKDRQFQLAVLDVLGGTESLKEEYQKNFQEFKALESEFHKKSGRLAELMREKDFNSFQLREIEELNLEKTDFSALEKEFELAANSEEINSAVNRLSDLINGDHSVMESLVRSRSELEKIKDFSSGLEDFYQRLNSLILEMKELGTDIGRYSVGNETDPERKEWIVASLDRYNTLLRKHRINDQQELLKLKEDLEKEVLGITELEEEVEQLDRKIDQQRKQLYDLASQLHTKREKAIPDLELRIKELLGALKLPDTQLQFKLDKRENLGPAGVSDLEMLFSANKGITPVSIEKAASGGELSRVMLVIQQLISEKKAIPTVLFDEIDTGVSGEVAQKIGTLLHNMGKNAQLIAITHLPQVAAAAEHHFVVEKYNDQEQTNSSVRELSASEHIEEVARLMSGDVISASAIQNAKELIGVVNVAS